MNILRLIYTTLKILLLTFIMCSWFYSSRCLVVGGSSALITNQGIYCKMANDSASAYMPLRVLENPTRPANPFSAKDL